MCVFDIVIFSSFLISHFVAYIELNFCPIPVMTVNAQVVRRTAGEAVAML